MQIAKITPQLAVIKTDALTLIQELDEIGVDIESKLNTALDKAWRLGVKLEKAKGLLGHGNWLQWVESNLPISARHARRHKELAEANPKARSVEDLSEDSVRKFRLGYVPDKERPELPGDQTLPRVFHHITLLNDFQKLTRRVEIGQATIDKEAARKDLWPVFEWLVGLYGLRNETISGLRPPQ